MAIDIEQIIAPSFNADQNGVTATWVVKIAWADIDEFLETRLGSSSISGDSISYVVMDRFPGKEWLFLDSIAVEPFDPELVCANDGDGVATSSYARCTLNYKTPSFDAPDEQGQDPEDPPQPFLTHSLNSTVTAMTSGNWGLRWEEDGFEGHKLVPEGVNPSINIIIMEHTLEWKNVPFPPWNAIRSNLGKVNTADFLGADPETILFAGINGHREYNVKGDKQWQLTYQMHQRIIHPVFQFGTGSNKVGKHPGWNHSYRDNPAENQDLWQKIVDLNGDGQYQLGDFAAIFAF